LAWLCSSQVARRAATAVAPNISFKADGFAAA